MVGMKRFKFDVFSNDVTLANEMESTGIAGRVHISEHTARFLDNEYILEDGPDHAGIFFFLLLRQLMNLDLCAVYFTHCLSINPYEMCVFHRLISNITLFQLFLFHVLSVIVNLTRFLLTHAILSQCIWLRLTC